MKKIISLFALLLVLVVFGQKKVGLQTSKVKTSEITWKGYKLIKSNTTSETGSLKLKSGKFYFENKVLTGGDFVIDMRSLEVTSQQGEDKAKLQDHLKSIDFFDVKKYPTATFKLTKFLPSKNPEYNYLVVGDLTLKGTRKTITFPARVRTNDLEVDFESAVISLNRREYKVYYQTSVRDMFIENQIDIKISLKTK